MIDKIITEYEDWSFLKVVYDIEKRVITGYLEHRFSPIYFLGFKVNVNAKMKISHVEIDMGGLNGEFELKNIIQQHINQNRIRLLTKS